MQKSKPRPDVVRETPAMEETRPDPILFDRRPVARHRVQLFSSSFRYARDLTLYGHAKLFGDRIELYSVGIHGLRRRRIGLDRVAEMDYHPLRDGSNLTLTLESGEVIDVKLENAHLWREFFEQWVHYSVLPSAKLLGGPAEVLDISG